MEKEKLTEDKKKRLILIAICVIVFILLILYIFYLLANKGSSGKSEVNANETLAGVQFNNTLVERDILEIPAQRCASDNKVCVRDVKILYEEIGTTPQGKMYRGTITYNIKSTKTEDHAGAIRMILGDYKIALRYGIGANSEIIDGVLHYDKFIFDLDHLNTYSIEYGGQSEQDLLYDNFANDPDAIADLDVNY